MKKLGLIFIVIILAYLLYLTIFEGFSFAGLEIPSYGQIQSGDAELKKEVADLQNLIDTKYANKRQDVASAKNTFVARKREYEELAAKATDAQLEAAMKKERFLLDYLWILVGNYANDNDVKFMMKVNDDEEYTIDFDVTGSYISIINFVYDLANDPELRFVIDNIKLEGGSNKNSITKGKFTVAGVEVVNKEADARAE